MVLYNSIVYGVLNTDVFINGDAYVRVDKDIRITGVKLIEQTNGAHETYNCDYSKDTTSLQVALPSSDSSITYEVIITNKSDEDYVVTNIQEQSYLNNNVNYEIINLESGTVIKEHTTYIFKVKLTTPENNSEHNGKILLKYTFETLVTEWTFAYTGTEQKFRVPHNGIYKIELWGAKGGNVTSYGGGAGGYVSGEIELSPSDIYITVGGSGQSNCGRNVQCAGGYNGGGKGMAIWSSSSYGSGGGGATHIAYKKGLLNELENNKDLVLAVAAGGGGAHFTNAWNGGNGGVGGGASGKRPSNIFTDTWNRPSYSNPGTSEAAGCMVSSQAFCGGFGYGGGGSGEETSGGGSGYYGGSGGAMASGSGGSSYLNSSFTNQVNLAGDTNIPIFNGTTTMVGNNDNGYAKISLIKGN